MVREGISVVECDGRGVEVDPRPGNPWDSNQHRHNLRPPIPPSPLLEVQFLKVLQGSSGSLFGVYGTRIVPFFLFRQRPVVSSVPVGSVGSKSGSHVERLSSVPGVLRVFRVSEVRRHENRFGRPVLETPDFYGVETVVRVFRPLLGGGNQ